MDGRISVGADLFEYHDVFHDDLCDGIFVFVLSLVAGERGGIDGIGWRNEAEIGGGEARKTEWEGV